MSTPAIFLLQFVLSLLVIGLLAKWILAPWLRALPERQGFFWLILPHTFRHIGMVFMVPGIVAQPLPNGFAIPAAYGDLAAGLLALLALIALRTRWAGAVPQVWYSILRVR